MGGFLTRPRFLTKQSCGRVSDPPTTETLGAGWDWTKIYRIWQRTATVYGLGDGANGGPMEHNVGEGQETGRSPCYQKAQFYWKPRMLPGTNIVISGNSDNYYWKPQWSLEITMVHWKRKWSSGCRPHCKAGTALGVTCAVSSEGVRGTSHQHARTVNSRRTLAVSRTRRMACHTIPEIEQRAVPPTWTVVCRAVSPVGDVPFDAFLHCSGDWCMRRAGRMTAGSPCCCASIPR